MHLQATEPATGGVCVAHGYGIKISVHRGHLVVHDGIGRNRQTRRYHRVTSKLRRLVLIGHTGCITLDALRWLCDIGAALVHIDADGRLLTTSAATAPGHAALRRAQALASSSDIGVEVARRLLHAKVAGQASLLEELPNGASSTEGINIALHAIGLAPDLPALVSAEAQAAGLYWDTWSTVTVPFGQRDRARVPEHWCAFGKRHSILSNGPRSAVNPPNAILNYLYALLEAETTLACHTVGLDPSIGIFHTDQRYRASFALDAMEPIRPVVDAYLLAMLSERTLSRHDFAETRQGGCRLTPDLAARLADTTQTWRRHVAPVVEEAAHLLARSTNKRTSLAAPLTGAHQRAAWADRLKTTKPSTRHPAVPNLANACQQCGAHLSDRRRRYCDDCRLERWASHARDGRAKAADVLARLRSEERDPAHGGRAAASRGAKNAAHQVAVREWRGDSPDPAHFAAEIQPLLGGVPIETLATATGLSEHYCSLIRLGKKIPHARHWDKFAALGEKSELQKLGRRVRPRNSRSGL